MDDLISRQAAIDAMEKAKEQYFDRRVIIGKMQDIVNNLPSADVVEVVRCKECKFYDFWERKGIHLCVRWSGDPYEAAEPGEEDFCSFAERRDDGET